MNRYLLAGIVTAMILALVFAMVAFLDNGRLSALNQDIDNLSLQSESNRILFFYTQVFNPQENTAFCDITNQSATLRSNQGDLLFSKLTNFEDASLLGNYSAVRQKYLLNRIELWLYTSLQNKTCGSNFVPVLFFYTTKRNCTECAVQGNILEELRNQCPNVKIFALSVDEGIDLVPLIQVQFGVTNTPALVVDNNMVFNRLTSKEEIIKNFKCVESSP